MHKYKAHLNHATRDLVSTVENSLDSTYHRVYSLKFNFQMFMQWDVHQGICIEILVKY